MAFQCFNLCVSRIYVSHIYAFLEVYINIVCHPPCVLNVF